MNKRKILEKLLDYFVEKGEVMDFKTYRAATDKPIRQVLVKRIITSWSRLPNILKQNFPAKFDTIGKPVEVKPSTIEKIKAAIAAKVEAVDEE